MKVLKYVILLLLLIVVAGSIYIATLENTYDVKRTRIIKAPIEVVYNNVNDFKNWQSWSPWLGKDSLTVLTYGEITSGEGASQRWESKVEEVGVGTINTISVTMNEAIHQKIEFKKPWESTSDIYWNFKSVDNGTEVTWGMKGELGFVSRAFMAFNGGMDKQVGPDYEKGLSMLDSVLQVNMQKYSVTVNGETTHGGGFYLYNTTSCKMDEMPTKMQEMMPKVGAYAQKNKIKMAGAPFVLYHLFDEENNAVMFSCAVPVAERVITESGSGILTGFLKPFKAIKTTLKGNYKNLKETWEIAYKYLGENGLEQVQGAPALEVYTTDPMQTPNPADWITEIYVPVKE